MSTEGRSRPAPRGRRRSRSQTARQSARRGQVESSRGRNAAQPRHALGRARGRRRQENASSRWHETPPRRAEVAARDGAPRAEPSASHGARGVAAAETRVRADALRRLGAARAPIAHDRVRQRSRANAFAAGGATPALAASPELRSGAAMETRRRRRAGAAASGARAAPANRAPARSDTAPDGRGCRERRAAPAAAVLGRPRRAPSHASVGAPITTVGDADAVAERRGPTAATVDSQAAS